MVVTQADLDAAAAAAVATATVAATNVYVPQLPDVEFNEVVKRFLDKKLPICEGEPNYTHFVKVRNMIFRNLRQIKSPFGGGAHGHLGAVMNPVKYITLTAGTDWTVPQSSPAVPTIPAGTSPEDRTV